MSDECVSGFTLPPGTTISDLPNWAEFKEYFRRREGFDPNPGDTMHRRMFEYYTEGGFREALFRPNISASPLWRERVHVQDVTQEDGEIWLRISAANAPRGTPPVTCFAPGQILVVEIQHHPLGVYSM